MKAGPKVKCAEPSCGKVQRVRGMCKAHYETWTHFQKATPEELRRLCLCGCGQKPNPPYRYVRYHHHHGHKPWNFNPTLRQQRLCACGCGQLVNKAKAMYSAEDAQVRFVHGHNLFGIPMGGDFARKPMNMAEAKLSAILESIAPARFLYNGGGQQSVRVGDKTPDFIDITNDHQAVELFGCYWHHCSDCGNGDGLLDQRNARTIKIYAAEHHRLIIVWQHELRHPDTLRARLIDAIT